MRRVITRTLAGEFTDNTLLKVIQHGQAPVRVDVF